MNALLKLKKNYMMETTAMTIRNMKSGMTSLKKEEAKTIELWLESKLLSLHQMPF